MATIDPGVSSARLIEQLNSLRDSAAGLQQSEKTVSSTDFAALMRQYVDKVNGAQQQAATLAADFEAGARDVQLLDVMVSMQKSRIAFESLVQVRNRFLSAYQEIMNM
ncbi:MAG: flagellar hook-basal body complex protein FliE, partial [Gammaproteobacteria bacterium]|nr:flagellar hook-basal body complex protein FliE [Gammaproteobacteria bacterium]